MVRLILINFLSAGTLIVNPFRLLCNLLQALRNSIAALDPYAQADDEYTSSYVQTLDFRFWCFLEVIIPKVTSDAIFDSDQPIAIRKYVQSG